MLDRKTVRAWHEELNALVEGWAKSKGIAFNSCSCSFDSATLTYKCKVSEADENGTAKMGMYDEMRCTSAAKAAGFDGNPVGRYFKTYRGLLVKIVSFNPRSPKYCWTIVTENGSRQRCSSNYIDFKALVA